MNKKNKIPYLVENETRDTFTIYVKGTKPYLELQQRIEELEQLGLTENGIATMYKERIDKAIEYIKTHSEMTDLQICGIENVLAFRGSATKLLEILGEKENE